MRASQRFTTKSKREEIEIEKRKKEEKRETDKVVDIIGLRNDDEIEYRVQIFGVLIVIRSGALPSFETPYFCSTY